MKNQKMYEADDSLVSIIRDNYNILQSLGSFGISLGFGDKTVREVCEEQGVDCQTFLAVVNFTINGYRSNDEVEKLSVPTLLKYLKASHEYYLGFELPFIRNELSEALDKNDSLAKLIMKLYDDYAHTIRNHMVYEEKNLFPYVESLIDGHPLPDYDIETFSKHHLQIDQKLKEL
ncbi:MAG: hemerythrin domain-containing protein, partial [Prevotella sp.]|nr:hemerythrin domain-containing protein [Prevotella sp.]